MPYVPTRDGHALYVRVLGRGEPVVLLHGFAADGRTFLPFVAPFVGRHRFILPDLRGFGLSHHLPLDAACPLTQFAEDVEDALAALAVERAALIGISMGAFTAVQSLSLFGATRFSRYMHIDQGLVIKNRDDYAHGLLGASQAPFFARVASLLARLDDDLLGRAYDDLPRDFRREFWELFGAFSAAAVSAPFSGLLARAARVEWVMKALLPTANWQVYVKVVRAYLERDYDLRDAFRAIAVPITVLIGGGSKMYPPAGQRSLRELSPHARIREIAHAGHLLPYEAPRAFLRELSSFLSEPARA